MTAIKKPIGFDVRAFSCGVCAATALLGLMYYAWGAQANHAFILPSSQATDVLFDIMILGLLFVLGILLWEFGRAVYRTVRRFHVSFSGYETEV